MVYKDTVADGVSSEKEIISLKHCKSDLSQKFFPHTFKSC